MIVLSTRLQAVADLVPHCGCVADVGTDHGYLAAWLLQNNVAKHVFATDIHAGPLERAKQTAKTCDITEKLSFYLCDGLQFREAQNADAVVIAGMGGETMISILQNAPWSWQNTDLILQPQSKQSMLFNWLRKHGIGLNRAVLCEDSGKRYMAVRARGGSDISVSAETLLLRAKDPLFSQYLKDELLRIDRALAGMKMSTRDLQLEREAYLRRRQELESYLREELT